MQTLQLGLSEGKLHSIHANILGLKLHGRGSTYFLSSSTSHSGSAKAFKTKNPLLSAVHHHPNPNAGKSRLQGKDTPAALGTEVPLEHSDEICSTLGFLHWRGSRNEGQDILNILVGSIPSKGFSHNRFIQTSKSLDYFQHYFLKICSVS